MPAKKRKAATRKKRAGAKGSLVCPECGFKAAHAMGLGRHRTSRHGVLSKRAMLGRVGAGRPPRSGDTARLAKRVASLEQRVDRLVKALGRASSQGR